jgi:hypothetical protein
LRKKPLDGAGLRLFFASTAEFFREVPGGILALALRLTDDWMPHARFGAVEKGAQILYSAVDEFGLHQRAAACRPRAMLSSSKPRLRSA